METWLLTHEKCPSCQADTTVEWTGTRSGPDDTRPTLLTVAAAHCSTATCTTDPDQLTTAFPDRLDHWPPPQPSSTEEAAASVPTASNPRTGHHAGV